MAVRITEADLRRAGIAVPSAPKPFGRGKPVPLVESDYDFGEGWLTFTVPLYLPSTANGGRLDRAAIGRAGSQRRAVANELAKQLDRLAPFARRAQAGRPVQCRIVRLGPRSLDDDNTAVAAKYVRDTIALFCGVEDSRKGPIVWRYDEERSERYGVRIELERGS